MSEISIDLLSKLTISVPDSWIFAVALRPKSAAMVMAGWYQKKIDQAKSSEVHNFQVSILVTNTKVAETWISLLYMQLLEATDNLTSWLSG